MAGDRDTLVGMGFDAARVDWALKATGGRGLQPAMDHILEHEGQAVPDLSGVSESSAKRSGAMDVDDNEDDQALERLGADASALQDAKSIKCSECGKIFKNTALANFHAEKSGHDQFEESTEEIKPLTEEEKKQKLEELKERLKSKRAQKSVQEAAENKANEVIRRKAGKDLQKLKEEQQAKEIIKEAEQKRRDKIEDAKARAAIKAQIEADKKARAEKAAREKALREGKPLPGDSAEPASVPNSAAAATAAASSSSTSSSARLQIRVTGRQPMVTTLAADAPLREVAEFVASQVLEFDADSITFSTTFPRKTFTPADYSKTLRELGLTPSAAIIASPS